MSVNLIDPATGKPTVVDDADVDSEAYRGWKVEGAGDRVTRLTDEQREEEYGGVAGKIAAGGAGILRGATLGGSDLAFRALGEEDDFRNVREVNPGVSTVSEIAGGLAGSVLGVGPAGAASRLGTRLAQTAEGAGTISRIGRAGFGAAVEGGITGAGSGLSEIALSEDPITVESATSSLSSNILFGGAVGGGAGLVGKAAEIGLSKASKAMREASSRIGKGAESGVDIGDDIAGLDAKGLRAARDAEVDAIEAARVPKRAELADEISAFRREIKEQKQFLTTKGVDLPAADGKLSAAELGRKAVKANKQLDNLLDNPTGLAKNPGKALDALQRQEDALVKLSARTDDLKVHFAADKSGERLAALDTIAPTLERNRALQAKIGELSSPATSPRLAALDDAKDALVTGGARKSGIGEQILTGAAYSGAAGLVYESGLPGGSIIAPLIGAKAAGMIGSKVFGRLGKATSEAAARSSRAVAGFFDLTGKAMKHAPVLATKVLGAVRYAPEEPSSKKSSPAPTKKTTLAQVYRARTEEIRTQTAYGPTGKPVMRPEARQAMAAQLAPIRVHQPILADRMETLAARRLEFLADKMPRRPDMGIMQTGPDHWQPSDMEMRAFARYAAAVEDPGGIEERLVDGSLTPEDAEVMRSVYPERYADIVRQIVEKLPDLQESLPYERRLALSIFADVPVDPSMHPEVLAVLQGGFVNEEGTEGGTQAPVAKPAFGSVKVQDATPSQRRQGAV
jgi:hypothetical protein